MKKKSLSRHSNTALNLTPHYKANLFDSGGPFANMTTAGLWDDSTKATLNNTGGEGSVSGVFAGVEGMLESGLQNAKLKSTYNIQRNIADNFGQALSNQNLNTNDQLMEAWDQYSPMSHISRKDIRGGSTLGRLWNTNMASIKGAEAGWNTGAGPIGAIIGGVVGLGTGIAGWVTGGRKASRLRDRINNEIDIANEFGYQNLAHQQANVEQKNLLRAEGNYVAYGGPLDKRLAGHQMQDIYGNGIPSANRFAGGGNAFVALGDQQTSETPLEQATKEKSLTETLIPYIMQAKQAREQREALALQQRQMAKYETQRQQQVAAQAAALAEAQGETPVETVAAAPVYSNKALIDSIKRFEGFSPKPIWDVTGYAIGYGDHNKKLNDYYLSHPNETYSEAEASKLIEQTVADTRKILAENIPNWNELSYAQQDALTSYGYNTGPWKIINNSPSLMKAIANKDWKAAAAAINRGWNQRNEKGQLLKGLRKRRNFERLAFLYPEMTTYGVLPDGTVVNPDNLVDVDLSKPYTFENGKWSNPIEYTVATDDTMPVYVSQKSYGGNLFAYGNPPTKAYPRLTQAQHLKELQALAAKYPELEGISTKEFVPWLNALAGTESTYNPYARSVNKGGKKGSYVGYYQLHENELGNDYSPDNQFKKAFKHLAGIFKNQMTKEDVLQAKKKGITPMQALYKYWNQGNRVTNWLYYNKDKADGAETLISEYGNDYNPKDTYDYSNYLRDANKAPYYVLRSGDGYYKASLGARNPSLIYNYTNYGVTDFPYNKKYPARNVGDTVALVNQPVEQFRKTVKAWDAKHAFGGNLFKDGGDVKDPKKQMLDLTLTKGTLLNNSILPTQKDNTKVAILQGEKAEKVLKEVQKEQERRAAVVEKEKLEAIKKGPHNFEATRKLEGFNQLPGYTSEPYVYTDEYNNSRTFIDKLFGIGKPVYPMYSGAGALEAFSPEPAKAAKVITTVDKIKELPGYQLKILLKGNPLEKQISKAGTVSVNNIKALANKGSNVEKAVIDKVLNGKFAEQKSVDYNQFRKAVQDELITYNRTTDKTLPYSDYGMDRLGFMVERDPGGYSIPGVPKGARADVLLFDSPRILQGSAKHYNPNTLGHSRTYTTVDEPNILHVMESQSDWAQEGIAKNRAGKILSANEHYPGGFEARRNKAITAARNDVESWKKMLKTGVAEDGRRLEPSELYNIRTAMLPNAERKLTEIEARFSYVDPQEIYLANNYTSKQLQENLRYAAEKGQTKMRYPTRETAAKIEGYSKQRVSNPELDKKFRELEDELKRAEQAIYEKYLPQNYIDDAYRDEYYLGLDNIQRSEAFDRSPEAAKMRKELIDVREKINPMKWFRENVPERYLPEHETILRKYDEFPKQYQKLFRGADVRTTVDPKGNSWYEVDVPKDYLNIEWPFKYGGKLKKH